MASRRQCRSCCVFVVGFRGLGFGFGFRGLGFTAFLLVGLGLTMGLGINSSTLHLIANPAYLLSYSTLKNLF